MCVYYPYYHRTPPAVTIINVIITGIISGEFSPLVQAGPRAPPSLLHNAYLVSFPGVEQPLCSVNHPPETSADNAEVKERVSIYIYSYWLSWPVIG